MRIAKAIKVYSITVPTSAPRRTSSFFDSPSNQTLYFRSREEAENHQKAHYANLSLRIDSKIAAEDKDEQGNDRWVLINKVENMLESNHNKSLNRQNYYLHEVNYVASASLKTAIDSHPSSVIAVKKLNINEEYYPASHYWVSHETQIVYGVANEVDDETRFLYVAGSERWFVESGAAIRFYVPPRLNLGSANEANHQDFEVRQNERQASILTMQAELEKHDRAQREQVMLSGPRF